MTGIRRLLPDPIRGIMILAVSVSFAIGEDASSASAGRKASREALFEAYRKGMSLDSLYFLLAAEASANLAYDTAMAFNLSIAAPVEGSFRDSVLSQRYRLYRVAGLTEDADRLRDSLTILSRSPEARRRIGWDLRLGAGYRFEDQGSARSYPSGAEVPGIDSGGMILRTSGGTAIPLPSPRRLPLALGLGYDLAKSYYKDSLDYRAEASLQAERLLDQFSMGLAVEAGSIAGVGAVMAYQGDLTWIKPVRSGWWLGHAGYESEWEGFRDKRYDAAWATLLREWDGSGGFSFQGSLSGTMALLEPFLVPGMGKVMFVDEVGKAQPTHYRDRTFTDTIPKPSRLVGFTPYAEAIDSIPFPCPQDVFTLRPRFAVGFQAPGGFRAEWGTSYAFAWFSGAYSWMETRGSETVPGDTVEFRGFALNRADGRYYRAYMDSRSGGFDEIYGTIPMLERREYRHDHRVGTDLAVARKLGAWGELRLEADMERTFSNLSGIAPLWIPEWEYGASLRWTMSGRKSP